MSSSSQSTNQQLSDTCGNCGQPCHATQHDVPQARDETTCAYPGCNNPVVSVHNDDDDDDDGFLNSDDEEVDKWRAVRNDDDDDDVHDLDDISTDSDEEEIDRFQHPDVPVENVNATKELKQRLETLIKRGNFKQI